MAVSKAIRKATKRADQLQGISPFAPSVSMLPVPQAITPQPFAVGGQLPTSFSSPTLR